MIVLLTWTNSRGLEYGKIVQNLFTSAKTVALAALILAGLFLGWNARAVHANFSHAFSLGDFDASLGVAAASVYGLIVALCVAQSGSLFSADSWHDVTIIAGEVKNPETQPAAGDGAGVYGGDRALPAGEYRVPGGAAAARHPERAGGPGGHRHATADLSGLRDRC